MRQTEQSNGKVAGFETLCGIGAMILGVVAILVSVGLQTI